MNITHDNFTAKINVNTWRIKQVIDHYNNSCTVWVHITSDDGSEYGIELPNRMPYGETWEDADVEVFIEAQLNEMSGMNKRSATISNNESPSVKPSGSSAREPWHRRLIDWFKRILKL